MKKIIYSLALTALFISCSESFLDPERPDTVTDDTVAQLAAESPEALLNTASSFDVGTINNLRTYGVSGTTGHNDFGQKSIDIMMDVMSNDMITLESNTGWFMSYYNYTARIQENSGTSVIWDFYYEIIKGSNQTIGLISGLPEAALTDDIKHVYARAKATRGYSYLNLIQIYQKGNPALTDAGIPLIDPTADILNGPGFGRATVQDTYNQIEKDLTESYTELSSYARPDKTSINKEVVAAYLARFYLISGKYNDAVTYARIAQAGGSLAGSGILDGFQFISNSEVLFGADLNVDTNSYYASFMAQMQSFSAINQANFGTTLGYPGQLAHHRTIDPRLYNQISSTDIRKNWFGPDNGFIKSGSPEQFYNYKFYDNTDFEADYTYVRVPEMYLIEAEALARDGKDSEAAAALFTLVSNRDSGYTQSTKTGNDLLEEIYLQRRIELWGEGFGLTDMKRFNKGLERTYTNSTHPQNSGYFDYPAGSTKFTFQIPLTEINLNDAITSADQNPI
jgi:hypothetical protein